MSKPKRKRSPSPPRPPIALTVTHAERDVLIEALDQFISNSEEVIEELRGLDGRVGRARSLLDRLQVEKLRDLRVEE